MNKFVSVKTTGLAAWLIFALAALAQSNDQAPDPLYEQRTEPNRDGIGKFYLGREISHVMGHQGASWLERPERAQEERTDLLIKALPLKEGDVVADIGAGSGYLAWQFAKKVGKAGRVLGVDIQPEMLEIMAEKMKERGVAERVEGILGTITDPNLPANSVDLAIMVDVYHELSHPYEMTTKMVEGLKPGGLLVFVEYRAEDPTVQIKRLHKMTEAQVKKEMTVQNLEFVETIGTLPQQHIVVFRKPESASLANDGVTGKERDRFFKINAANWNEVFFDSCNGDWRENWSLDGLKSKVTNSAFGMNLQAGPVPKEDASHTVLWTKRSFEGDLKIEYEYTRTDEANQFVTILYIQATGSGEGVFSKDISTWADQRTIPAMKTYFNNMNSYHISYAAYGGDPVTDNYDYIRARRYMPSLKQGMDDTELPPTAYERTGLFEPGIPHQITVIKKGDELFMMIKNPEKEYLCHWVNDKLPPIYEGPIGLRHMWTRSARYKNFRVSILKE
jgi:ubiquinone/menaquinone biosynthesis C-methylase UbiE